VLPPHCPALHTPLQHSVEPVQLDPGPPQGAHVPWLQMFEQQSLDSVQVAPSPTHAEHLPALH
jgi:hypothetical protein